MKSGNLNFLEPFGPLQACNGTDLPLSLTIVLSEDDRKVSEVWSKLLYFNKRALVPTERVIDTSSCDDNRNVLMHRSGSATGLSGFTCPDRTAATTFYHWQL